MIVTELEPQEDLPVPVQGFGNLSSHQHGETAFKDFAMVDSELREQYNDDPGFEYDWMGPEEDPSKLVSVVIKNERDRFDNDPETDFRGDLKITTVWKSTYYKMIPRSIILFIFQDGNDDFLHDYDNTSFVGSDSDVDGEIDDDVIDVNEDEPEDLHELEQELATEVCSLYLFALEFYSNNLRVKIHWLVCSFQLH